MVFSIFASRRFSRGSFGRCLIGITIALSFSLMMPAAMAQDDRAEGDTEEQHQIKRRLIDATNQEEEWTPSFRMSPAEEQRELIQRGDQALAAGRIEGESGAIALFARAVTIDSGSAQAQSALSRGVAEVVRVAESALARGRFDEATRLAALAQRYRRDDRAVVDLAAKLASGREQAQRLATARQLFLTGKLVEPAGDNAAELYRQALASEPGNQAARSGLAEVENALVERAVAAAGQDDFSQADRLLAQAAQLQTGSSRVQDASVSLLDRRQARAQALAGDLGRAIDDGDLDRAGQVYAELERVSVQGEELEALRRRLDNARNYASFSPGDRIVDPIASGGEAPELVVIPLGSFEMGSPNREAGRVSNEGPAFTVKFARGFAMGRTEVTVGQFRQFVNATGYVTQSQKLGRGTVYDESTGSLSEKSDVTWQDDHAGKRAGPDLPVIHVSWADAKAYVDWLSRETGKRYRLPSEAEFEYGLRAGGRTSYPWGEGDPKELVGNLTGVGDRSETGRNWANAFRKYNDGHWGPAPVGTFPTNPFGLHDMVGNVSEWVEDCWHDTYQRAPTDGSAWVNPGCELRVLRGASWASAPDQVRSAFRLSAPTSSTNPRLGFRVAREL